MVTGFLKIRPQNGPWRVSGTSANNNGNLVLQFGYPLITSEKTDIEISSFGATTNNIVSTGLSMILVEG